MNSVPCGFSNLQNMPGQMFSGMNECRRIELDILGIDSIPSRLVTFAYHFIHQNLCRLF